ncbi:Acyl-CoA N-acyltransferase [Penicillium hispanicum]|uniref:Acyl-CoA N-acyltransferase n=1 Tax=Penicillium hispanicum TaxID=1080232 RepID=UPI002540FDA4|nr:Acyl-CoA N-acyltransferase [Penicillium hispanicum]KAJ5573994.1 Acyl-CoA N-acyltransferase [Penicillium hispanicum]
MDILPPQPVYVVIPSPAPSVESSRLLLRPVADSDLRALFAIRARPEVAQFNYPKTPFGSLQETQKWVSSKVFNAGPPDVIGRSFNYAILDKLIPETEERLIGYVSINELVPSPEIGYSLVPEAWNKGYATEALQLMLKMWWSLPRRIVESDDHEERVDTVYALCETNNQGSSKVLQKCGFQGGDTVQLEGHELRVWGLRRPQESTSE